MSCEACNTSSPVWDCGCFRNTEKTDGATTLARLYVLQETGQLDGATANGVISNIVSYGYTIANVQCKQAFVDEQVFDIECNNAGQGELVLNNPNCTLCKQQALAVAKSRAQLEADAKARNPDYTVQKLDSAIEASFYGPTGTPGQEIGPDGICQFVCEQCIAANLSQNISMRIVEECSDRVTSEAFRTAFTSGMSLQAETELTKHQAGLESTGVQIQSQADIQSLSIGIANTLNQMTINKQLSGLYQDALNIQETTVEPGSTSVVLQNVSQAITVSMFASLVSRTYTDTNIQNSINYNLQRRQIEIETSFFDLVQSLEVTVKTMDTLILSTVGKIMITITVILMVILLIFAAFFFFKPSFLFGGGLGGALNST